MVRAMQQRVVELEKQLADRESLIKSLEVLRLEGNSNRDEVLSYADLQSIAARSSVKKRSTAVSHHHRRSHPMVVLSDEETVDISQPRIVNLNQDPLFSECLVYYVPTGLLTVGSSEAELDVLICGPDVLPRHCTIHNDGENIWVEPLQDAIVYLNVTNNSLFFISLSLIPLLIA